MNFLFHDIKAGIKFIAQLRAARKAGSSEIHTKTVWRTPDLHSNLYGGTLESCLLFNMPRETYQACRSAFYTLPEATQHALTFTPQQPGEWIQRAVFWREMLRPVLPPKEFHRVMGIFVRHYVKCLRQHKAAASQQASRV